MPQTSVTALMLPAYEGQLADSGPHDIITRYQGEASAGIGFGLCVVEGAADAEAVLPVDANSRAVGIVLRDAGYATPSEYNDASNGIQPNAMVSILRKGRVWVRVEAAVAKGDPFFVRHVAGGGERKGAIRKDADSSDCLDLTGSGRFVSASQSVNGQLMAILDVDFTNR